MDEVYGKSVEAAEYIESKIKGKPLIGIVLGSGLGSVVGQLRNVTEIDYNHIPHFPQTTVEGHAGKLLYGTLEGKQVLIMQGRFHYYEGYDIAQVVFHIRVFKKLGINNLLITNAAGAINRSFKPGDLMIIKDHISLFAPSPLRGQNISEFGTRFPDMNEAYDKTLIEMAIETSAEEKIEIRRGIYAFTQGPMYETPAEIRALEIMGADAVGMSTVPEVITARHSGMKVLGISCITNVAAGLSEKPPNHQEVIKIAAIIENKFTEFVKKLVEKWPI